ncbi:outer membrane lipid asymmetry maintenance protein MlaD [Emcibacter sp. SYSU 3D8]|uniref:outer membrane lipid asymmetry maintenance protein MlaD n=1 Tax=Emcibacter sp. SYSU 3D8 TaxID=3133969 RepID=UPI0031FE9786
MRGTLVETLIGSAVLFVAAWFLYFAYSRTEMGPVGGYQVSARFDKVGDLANGADVKISGIKIGTVTAQKLDPKTYEAVVEMGIQTDVELPEDTTAKIAASGLLGGSYVNLEPGGSEELLKSGDRISYTQGAVDLMGLLGRFIYGSTDTDGKAPSEDAAPAAPSAEEAIP